MNFFFKFKYLYYLKISKYKLVCLWKFIKFKFSCDLVEVRSPNCGIACVLFDSECILAVSDYVLNGKIVSEDLTNGRGGTIYPQTLIVINK